MLTVDDAVDYLLDHGLITVESILAGELAIVSVPRRNRNLRVERLDGPGYLIKQPEDPASGARHTLGREAEFLRFCQREPAMAELGRFLPRLLWADPAMPVFAFELLAAPVQLWQRYEAADPEAGADLVATARAFGDCLGSLHRGLVPLVAAEDGRLGFLPRSPPWVLRVHQPAPELLASLSQANYQTLRILQTDERLAEHFDGLARRWRLETVIHGDVKSDNVLVRAAEDGAAPEVRLVDWELVQVGDPAWDVAGALQDFVLFWLFSMPFASGAAADELVAAARHPLPAVQPAIRSFWRGYAEAARVEGRDPSGTAELLARAVAYSAARLIQTAYELAHDAPALPAASVLLLEVGANLLADPAAGQVELYGLWQGWQAT